MSDLAHGSFVMIQLNLQAAIWRLLCFSTYICLFHTILLIALKWLWWKCRINYNSKTARRHGVLCFKSHWEHLIVPCFDNFHCILLIHSWWSFDFLYEPDFFSPEFCKSNSWINIYIHLHHLNEIIKVSRFPWKTL